MEDSAIRQRFLCVEDAFLSSVGKGPHALQSFSISYQSLQEDVERAMLRHTLTSETLSLVKVVSSKIDMLSETFLETYVESHSLTEGLMEELDSALTHFGLVNEAPSSSKDGASPSLPSESNTLGHLAKSSTPAYDWFLDNLHNPYPHSSIKSSLQRCSGINVKDIDSWFSIVRQDIGWTALVQQSFAGSRSRMLKAAHLAYKSSDSGRSLSPDLKRAFNVIRSNLQRLPLSSRCFHHEAQAELAHQYQRLAVMRNQIADGTSALEEIEREMEQSHGKDDLFVHSSITSLPCPSIGSPLTSDLSDEEDTTPPPPIAGFKRRIGTEEPAFFLNMSGDMPLRHGKRARLLGMEESSPMNSPPSGDCPHIPTQSSPSSPHSSCLSTVTFYSSEFPAGAEAARPVSPSPIPSRKRRLSDVGPFPLQSKRPRNIQQGPRVYAVSDPLPAGTGGNRAGSPPQEIWAQLFTNDPGPISIGDVDPSNLLNIGASEEFNISSSNTRDVPLSPVTLQSQAPENNSTEGVQALSVSDVLALLSTPNPGTAASPPPTVASSVDLGTFRGISESVPINPQSTSHDARTGLDPPVIDWGHFDDITLSQFPTGEFIATQDSVVSCPHDMSGFSQSMSLVDDMLLPLMFNPDMNPPPDTFGLDIYSGFGDQSQTWTGLWDLD